MNSTYGLDIHWSVCHTLYRAYCCCIWCFF